MLEKFKTSFLVFLICLSILLTYRLWFGRPPIEEGILPRYELAYFTETPSLSRIILPSKIIFEHEGLKYIFQRGEQNTEQLWEETLQIMMLPGKIMTQIEKEEVLDFFTKSSFKAIYQFSPLLPPEFISERLSFISSAIQEVIFLWDEKLLRIIVCAEKHYFWELPGLKGQVLQEKLL
jgi:regulatory protein YycH of two-component signal transduction system YycFG